MEKIDIFRHQSSSYIHEVSEICAPLFRETGINYFDYARFYENGEVLLLYTDADWVNYFLNDAKYIEPPALIKVGAHLWESYIDDEFIEKASTCFNYKHGLTICRDKQGYNEVFNFSSPRENKKVLSLYTNSVNLLYGFCDYFLEKSEKILQKLSRLSSNIHKKSISSVKNQGGGEKLLVDTKSLDLMIEFSNPKNSNNSRAHISNRELECVSLLLKGYGSKLIARELDISPRTVERHLDNVKLKFNCRTSLELAVKIFKSSSNIFLNDFVG